MSNKRVPIGGRPVVDHSAEAWIQRGRNDLASPRAVKADIYTARLTIDVTPELRARIKVTAFQQGVTVVDLLRVLLEREFGDTEAT